VKFLCSLFGKNIATEQTTHQRLKGGSWQEAARPLSGYSWLIVALGIFLISGLWLFVWQQINYDYNRTIEETSKETMNLAIAYEEHVRRIVADADKELLNLKKAYERDGISSPLIAAYVNSAGNDPARNQVSIANEQGIVVASFNKEMLATNVSDRGHFQFQRSAASDNIFIGKPIQSRIAVQNTIPLSRRINKPDGSFGGMVYIGLKSDYFLDYYKKLDLGEHQLLALDGLDGFNRVRQVGDNYHAGQDVRGSDFWKEIQAGRLSGTHMIISILDGINRVISYRVMPEYPLTVLVGISNETALAGFEKRKESYIGGATLASLFVLVFCGLLINRAARLQLINSKMTRLDRLNIIGEMAASIGHEVRNPLTTVRGYLQHFGMKAPFAPYHNQLELMIEELDRANGIITGFLSLAKDKTLRLNSTDLNQVIQSIALLLQSDALLRGSNIELELEDIPEVLADDKEIRQCILNLVRNGLDAIPKGGKVTIGTAKAGTRVIMTVRDNGPGIPPEIIEKLGTPFFSTKENGSGLGLSVCYRIAQRHHANIEVETSSEGSAFHFIFNLQRKTG